MAVEVGQPAPDFTLKDQDGNDVTLSSFRGQRNVVLVFFPLAFSPVCTRQLTAVGGQEARYAGADAQVLGISVDSRWAQKAFAEALGLEDARLLADFEPKGEVARRYGVYLDERGYANRASFVIDGSGVVRHAEVMTSPGDIPDEEASFAALAACSV
jgi:mycoredoxin-dependent peroxiredoxin